MKELEYRQTFYGIAAVSGGLKRWSQNGPPALYPTNAAAATECEDGEYVLTIRLGWKQPAP